MPDSSASWTLRKAALKAEALQIVGKYPPLRQNRRRFKLVGQFGRLSCHAVPWRVIGRM